ncbi:MAG TPA: TCP-1/cpn60 chaperonin family protein [Steroidobacter sp.]|nr:TCP-1/cpn60 chaperonin family protein [Steroidobacter sp.]
MRTQILQQDAALMSLFNGAEKLVSVVGQTLGPRGRSVVTIGPLNEISHSSHGLVIADAFQLHDRVEQLGVRLVRHAVLETARFSEDSSTTAAIFAGSLLMEATKLITNKNPVCDVVAGIRAGLKNALSALKDLTMLPSGSDALKAVAVTTARGSVEEAELALKAYTTAGQDGWINVRTHQTPELNHKRALTLRINGGCLIPGRVRAITGAVACDQALRVLLLPEERLTIPHDTLCSYLRSIGAPILLVARGFRTSSQSYDGEERLIELVRQLRRDELPVIVVQAVAEQHYHGAIRTLPAITSLIEDFALFTGARGVAVPSDLNDSNVGRVHGVIAMESDDGLFDTEEFEDILERTASTERDISRPIGVGDRLRVVGEPADQQSFRRHVSSLQSVMGSRRANPDPHRKRVALALGKQIVLTVSALTEAAADERKRLLENIVGSIENAVQGGMAPGGGAALAHASFAMADTLPSDEATHAGYAAFREALLQPLNWIAANSERDARAIQDQCRRNGPRFGFDARTARVCDLVDAGVLDPMPNLVSALETGTDAALEAIRIGTICIETEEMEPDDEVDDRMRGAPRRPPRPAKI